MVSRQDYTFRAGVALVSALASGVVGVDLYSPAADVSDRAFAGLLLGVALIACGYAVKIVWRGITDRRLLRDRRQPLRDSFTNDRRQRDLGNPVGPDRRSGMSDRRLGDRRSRFA